MQASRRPSSFFYQEENTAYNIILGSPTRWAISMGLTVLLVMLVFQANTGHQKIKTNSIVPPQVSTATSRSPIRPLETSIPDQKCQNTQQGKDFITDDEGESRYLHTNLLCMDPEINMKDMSVAGAM